MNGLCAQEVKLPKVIKQDLSFAVVIPVYNGEAFIARALKSCIAQTIAPAEIIVVDDASTDETAQLVSSLNHPHIQYCRNEKNQGPSYCRNTGMHKASADWIVFLDADDVFHPQKIKVLQECIHQQPNAKAIGHAFDVLGDQPFAAIVSPLPLLKEISAKQVLLRNPVVTPALAVLRSNTVLFSEDMVYAEDHDFILRTAEQYGLWYIDLPLCSLGRVPLTSGGISGNKWKMRKGEMRLYANYAKRHRQSLSIPFLLLFSLVKHIRQWMFGSKQVRK